MGRNEIAKRDTEVLEDIVMYEGRAYESSELASAIRAIVSRVAELEASSAVDVAMIEVQRALEDAGVNIQFKPPF